MRIMNKVHKTSIMQNNNGNVEVKMQMDLKNKLK